jgi:hypothetical protein
MGELNLAFHTTFTPEIWFVALSTAECATGLLLKETDYPHGASHRLNRRRLESRDLSETASPAKPASAYSLGE